MTKLLKAQSYLLFFFQVPYIPYAPYVLNRVVKKVPIQTFPFHIQFAFATALIPALPSSPAPDDAHLH